MIMSKSFDAIVIGTGQSGPFLALKLAKAGQSVAIIERGRFGGTCVNTGCIPTKAMVASARAAYMAKRGADFGVNIAGGISMDMKRVKARKDEISGASRTAVEKGLTSAANCSVFRGHARFVSDREVEVGGDVLTAGQIFINVGARASIPAIPGLSKIPYLTNSSILEIDFLPKNLIVVGGGYVGLEFGQMFRRFGSDVIVLQRGASLLGREDADVSTAIRDILMNESIKVELNAECLDLDKVGDEIEVRTGKAGSPSYRGTHVLIATGRQPNTDDLGLETTSVKRDARGYVEVDDQLRTSAAGVWALGDCNGRGAFTHTSYNDYEIVAANLLAGDKRRVSDRLTAYAVYIDPPLGRVGMTEAEVRSSGRKALMAKRPMTKVGRAYEKSETQGFMKVLVDADRKEILGASILGTGGDEAIHCILDVMYAKSPYTVLQRAVHIHPTVSELIPTMLGDLQSL
jgi:pyruvate/2-oxoglutarate dehydrogenase complex dihydrolipoamide dehydrogenase (E3) component